MSIQAGLVGLPNVGKSTLFNALTKSSIPAENYPFCTIDPHVAITEVPDNRLEKLKTLFKSNAIIPATVQFVDIAGLVKGASQGEGLGNTFLSHIREVDLILHVLRCFDDPNIIHTSDKLDPVNDYEIIMSELMLKDLESVEKRLAKLEQLRKGSQGKPVELKEIETEHQLLTAAQKALNAGNEQELKNLFAHAPIQTVPLLSSKNALIIANIAEHEIEHDGYKNNVHYQALVKKFGVDHVIPVSAKVECELSQLSDADAQDMMDMIGLKQKSLDIIIQKTYEHLGLITFFTCGPREIHAWPILKNTTVRKAASEIHSDLERGFICAEVFNAKDFFEHGSETKLKDLGKIRKEGQDYIVQDGDIILIRFNVS
jgi:ribosome-binding ATPase